MTDQTSFDTATRIAAGDDGTDYDAVAIALHWATAFLVVANFALAQTWDWFAKSARALMEERVLSRDAAYASYCRRVSWHLVPGVF